jgi:hypothetical protein
MRELKKLIQGKNKSQVFLVLGSDHGIPCYHYLLVHNGKAAFLKKQAGTTLDLQEFGTVIAKGFGAPPPSVRQQMKEQYNFEE